MEKTRDWLEGIAAVQVPGKQQKSLDSWCIQKVLSSVWDLECGEKKDAVWTLGLTAVVRLWDTSRLGQTLFV